MSIDVSELKAFYHKPQGGVARALITQGLKRYCEPQNGLRVLGFGYTTPYLGIYRHEKITAINFMPAQIGARPWPTRRPSRTALVDESLLPLSDQSIDVALLVHALENAKDNEALLHEIWRVLAPQGKLLLVTPNRLSIWAQSEKSPFSHGRPFTSLQLNSLLQKNAFQILNQHHALLMPPSHSKSVLRFSQTVENIGNKLHLPYGGVVITHAIKQMHRPIMVKKARILLPQLSPSFSNSRIQND